MNRKKFFSRSLEYLFSFDLDLTRGRRGANNALPKQITSAAALDDAPQADAPPTVYHALRESHVLGEPVVKGHVVLTQERVDFMPGEDFGEISGRLVLRTTDDALIETKYHGVVRANSRWPLLWGDAGQVGSATASPLTTRAHIAAHFETGSTKYNWLVQHQCIGYGTLTLKGGEPASATFDIYALGA